MPSDIDDYLRDYARRWREQQPEPPHVTMPSQTTKATRLERRYLLPALAAAAIIAVAALIAAAVTASRSAPARPSQPAPAVVAWNPTGQAMATTMRELAAPVGASVTTRSCSGRDFTLIQQATTTLATTRWESTQYTLRSTATTDCAISTFGFQTTIVGHDGHVLPNDVGGPNGGVPPTRLLLVQPGQFVHGGVTWFWTPGTTPRPDRIYIDPIIGGTLTGVDRFSLPVADAPIAANPIPPNVGTARAPVPWRAGWANDYPLVTPPDPRLALAVSISAPSTVRIGSTLRYQVTLTNHTADPISLSPCPQIRQVFTMTQFKKTYSVGTSGPLNCAAAGNAISANASTTFAFEINTTGVLTGDGYIQWQLITTTAGPTTTTPPITVTP